MKFFDPRPKIILSIGDDGVIAVPVAIPDAEPFFAPTDNGAGDRAVLHFVEKHPQASLTLLADNLAIDYRPDDLPPLNPFDRAKLLKRRLAQAFPAARLTAFVPFKKTPRRALLIGIHEKNSVFVWADRLRGWLPEIVLLPVEGAGLAARLAQEKERDGWLMLLSRHKSGGFRQIVTYKNDLVFTRLTPLSPKLSARDERDVVARDIKASLQYLARYGLRDPKELSVILLTTTEDANFSNLYALSLKSVRCLSPTKAATCLALPFAPPETDPHADLLFAATLVSRTMPSLSLRLPDVRDQWRTRLIQKTGLTLSRILLAVACLLFVGKAFLLAGSLFSLNEKSNTLAATLETLEQTRSSAAPLTEPLGRLRLALERSRLYENEDPVPWPVLHQMAYALDRNFRLLKLTWDKKNDTAPETLTLTVELIASEAMNRSETVASFGIVAQNLAEALPEFSIIDIRPPFPARPDETVTPQTPQTTPPIGSLVLQRKRHD